MSIEDRLNSIFKESFQVKRVAKQIENIRESKHKLGLEVKYSLTRNVHLSIFIDISKAQLKAYKNLSFLNKLEFKIVLKATYPSQTPRLYFLSQNIVQFALNPFHDYMPVVCPDWTPRITVIQIIKKIPAFIASCMEGNVPLVGKPLLNEYFEAERLFIYPTIQVFPVRLSRGAQICQGMLALVNQVEIILLEQTNFQNSFYTADFISVHEVQSIQKHKTRPICAMFQIKRAGSKYAVQFYSDEYHNIISAVSDAMKTHQTASQSSKSIESESSGQEQVEIYQKQKHPKEQLLITDLNIYEIQSQIMILQSLVENQANSKNIKELVELLKKTVEYFSVKGDPKCQMYLKSLQNIMGNEMMQVLLESEDKVQTRSNYSKDNYESIADLV